jgi:hypothetical protein
MIYTIRWWGSNRRAAHHVVIIDNCFFYMCQSSHKLLHFLIETNLFTVKSSWPLKPREFPLYWPSPRVGGLSFDTLIGIYVQALERSLNLTQVCMISPVILNVY